MKLFKLVLLTLILSNSSIFAADLPSTGPTGVIQNNAPDLLRDRINHSPRIGDNSDQRNTDQSNNSNSIVSNSGTQVCPGEFALCASSTCTRTGREIEVKEDGGKTTRKYPEVSCKCPIITEKIAVEQNGVPLVGIAAVNEGNMHGSCATPKPGTVWSYFSKEITLYPQESATPSFSSPGPAVAQTCPASSGIGSNCWDYLCQIDPKPTNGVRTATCLCPYGEALFGAKDRSNADYITYAGAYSSSPSAACAQYPVGYPKQLLQ